MNVLFHTTFIRTVMTYCLQTAACRYKSGIQTDFCILHSTSQSWDQRYRKQDMLREAPSIIWSRSFWVRTEEMKQNSEEYKTWCWGMTAFSVWPTTWNGFLVKSSVPRINLGQADQDPDSSFAWISNIYRGWLEQRLPLYFCCQKSMVNRKLYGSSKPAMKNIKRIAISFSFAF